MRALWWLFGLSCVTACTSAPKDSETGSTPRAQARGPVACEVDQLLELGSLEGTVIAGNSQTIVTGGSDNVVRLFDVAEHQQLGALQGHHVPLLGVAAGGDPLRVVTLDGGGTIFEWDVSTLLED